MPEGKRSAFFTKITNRFISVWAKLHGEDSSGFDTKIQTEDDGELKNVAYGKDGSSNLLPYKVEATTGEQDVVNHGKASGTVTAIKTEATGEVDIVLHGKDSGSNIDPLLTNANKALVVEVSGLSNTPIEVPPVALSSAEGELWDPGTTAADLYYVEFTVNHITVGGAVDETPVRLTIGQGVGGGVLARPYYWVVAYPIGYPGVTEWFGPFVMAGDDTIRGNASAVNTLDVHFRVRKVA